jgi:Tol biopolymer transport system component
VTRDPDLAARLRAAEVPDALGAGERGWRVVAAAYAERDHGARLGRWIAPALALAACVALAVLALTPPGAAVGDWVRDVVRPAPKPAPVARPILGPVPGHGRLLVVGPTGPWIVQPDGSRRRLGSYDAAAFSPRGPFVAVTRGRMLAAVDPRGGVRWSLSAPAVVTHPAWSPDGFRIAYRAGSEMRVVYGDGARDAALAAGASAVTPAWQPVAAHRLAYATGSAVLLRDADSGRRLWRARLSMAVTQLAWAPNGQRLVAVTREAAVLLDARGHQLRRVAAPAGSRARAVDWLPSGRAFAYLRTSGASSDVVLVPARAAPRRAIAVRGRLSGLLASPDGRWLLLSAPDADQWLFVRTTASGRITARAAVARQFDPGRRSPGGAPRLAGWVP